MRQFDTIILGATMAGVAAAEACRGDCLVVDGAVAPGHEFAAAFEPGFAWDGGSAEPAAAARDTG